MFSSNEIGHDEHGVVLIGWNNIVGRVHDAIVDALMQLEQLAVVGRIAAIGALVHSQAHRHEALALHLRGHGTRHRLEHLIALVVDELPSDDVAQEEHLHDPIGYAHAKRLDRRRTCRRVREHAETKRSRVAREIDHFLHFFLFSLYNACLS